MDVSVLEQVKIQARVLIPLIKAFQAELGEQRANAIVRSALAATYRALGEKWWRAQHSDDLGLNMSSAFQLYGAKGALEYEVRAQSQDSFELDVTACRYAEFFKQLGEPELGFLLVCGVDFPMAEGFGQSVELARSRTIMQGSSTCDFRYKRQK